MELELRDLNRYYGDNHALKDFSYVFSTGVYGLLGPNGAGKSTLVNILTDNLRISGGSISFNGKEIRELGVLYRKNIGYVPQQQQVLNGFTLRRFLLYIAGLKGLSKKEAWREISEVTKQVNLQDVMDKKLSTFSGGMKQRALLAQALLGNPSIIILDEPTAGLDPSERIRFRNIVSKVAFDRIVIIATHIVSDIQYIANRIIIMKNGKICTEGAPWELSNMLLGKVFEIYADEKLIPDIENRFKVADMIKEKDGIRIRIVSDIIPEGYDYRIQTPGLEDVYLYMV